VIQRLSNKEEYRKICDKNPEIPVFSQAWWLDVATDHEEWDVVIVKNNETILGTMPYIYRKKYFFTELTIPLLSQNLGPYIFYPKNQTYIKRLHFEKKVMISLINGLPEYDFFYQNFHYSLKNWLPFYWKDFQQTTRYTYVLEDLTDLDKVFNKFSLAKRQNIKKARKLVQVKYDLPSREFFNFHDKVLKSQDKKITYSYKTFKKRYEEGYKRNQAKSFYAVDKENNIHAALFIIWDMQSAYALIGPIDPKYKSSGAFTLLIWEAICFAATVSTKFDFEGSMIENVENSYNQFGGIQRQYFSIKKYNSILLKLKNCFNEIIKRRNI
jgi:hypothetical protein